jgi:hypothetical protein
VDWPGLRAFTAEDEAARAASGEEDDDRGGAVAACAGDGGHQWHLEIDPWDGISFGCSRCPAGADDLIPDGIDLLVGEFEVYPGYALSLECGSVLVNGKWRDGPHMYGWRGPVTATVRAELAPNYFDGYEYEYYVDLTAS